MTSMNLKTARAIVAGALEHAGTAGFKPLAVVVLDAGGHLVAAERQDGSSNKRYEVAYGKASGGLALGMGSRALMTRAEQQPSFIAAVTHSVGALIPVPGGVLVKSSAGEVVGAVGISGDTSDNDEAAALAGIEGAGLVGQPD
jgi:uncharacterized protein GlcG (DUF336 family)